MTGFEQERRNTRAGETPVAVELMELEIARWEEELILLERVTDHKRDILQGRIDKCAAKILKHYEKAEARKNRLRATRPSRAKSKAPCVNKVPN